MNSMFKYNRSGQTLIEVVVAVGIAVMLSVSLITTSLVTQRTARAARNNTQATNLAQEYVEKLRIMRDRQGFDALSLMFSSSTCMSINDIGDVSAWTLASCTDPGSTIPLDNGKSIFWRKIVSIKTATKIDYDVIVAWDDSSGRQTVHSRGFLTKWDTL